MRQWLSRLGQWGCFGLTLGGLIGVLLAILFFVWIRHLAAPVAVQPVTVQPVTVASADVNLFLSESLLSRFASESLESATLVEFDSDGQMEVVTRVTRGRLKPVVRLGLSLEIQDTGVASQLQWVQMGFLKFPAGWLPRGMTNMGALPGEIITQQVPPGFELVGLTTTPEGIEFQLNWVGGIN
jgi:hypothetical protein